MKKLLNGFTLIELLIVVLIIAILAAIAVPNFLEFQVRAKVSRVKSDMRSMATAIEGYRVDNGAYPIAYESGSTINPRVLRLTPLTTPIAYITSIPEDVFNKEDPTPYTNAEVHVFLYADKKSYSEEILNAIDPSSGYNGANFYRILWGEQFVGGEWLLRSRGPNGEPGGVGNSVDKRDAYDPTNGTVSNGNIFYLGPGIGPL